MVEKSYMAGTPAVAPLPMRMLNQRLISVSSTHAARQELGFCRVAGAS
jgi:hypothetical protein